GSISNSAIRAHFSPRTVFAASATAFSAAFAKLSFEVPIMSMTFCTMIFLRLCLRGLPFGLNWQPSILPCVESALKCPCVLVTVFLKFQHQTGTGAFVRSGAVRHDGSALGNSR